MTAGFTTYDFADGAEPAGAAAPFELVLVVPEAAIEAVGEALDALDALSGQLLWKFDPEVPRSTLGKTCCGPVNRGVAVWKGRVYVAALDGRLRTAVETRRGRQLVDVQFDPGDVCVHIHRDRSRTSLRRSSRRA